MTTTFASLGLAEPILRALAAENYETPTPIQAQAIPALLAGKDLLGIAQTGTGKTAAFSLPILNALAATRQPVVPKSPRVLVLAPTRELAVQIGDAFRTYGRHLGFRQTVIVGGVGFHPQLDALRRGVDILVATPGRLLDHMQQKNVRFDRLTHLVLDEADRMLDMGFVRDVRRIVAALPKRRQSMFFSATMPPEVAKLAGEMLYQPARVEVTPEVVTVDRIQQSVHFVHGGDKRTMLVKLLGDAEMKRVIVFTRTKHGANKVSETLSRSGVRADAIHGNKSQNARQRALEDFREGKVRVLVATDIAARGIDVDGITHVVNFEIPNVPETYVHRIGRTARAGADGVAISLCDGSERAYLRDIERLTKRSIAVASGSPAQAGGHAPRAENGGHRNGQHRGGEHRGGEHRNGEHRNGEHRDGEHRHGHRHGGHGKPHHGKGRNGYGRHDRAQSAFNGNGLIRPAQPQQGGKPDGQRNGHAEARPSHGHPGNGLIRHAADQGSNGQAPRQNGHHHNGERRDDSRRDGQRPHGHRGGNRGGFGPRWAARG